MSPVDVIETVQTDFQARLKSLPFFQDIYVAAPRLWKEGEKLTTPKEITEMVDQSLRGLITTNGKVGATVRIFQPTFSMKKTNAREGVVMLVCRCEVNPIINAGLTGTQKNVSRIGYEVLRAGQGYSPMIGFCTLFADGECFIPYVSQDRNFATVDVLLQANVAVSPVTMPVTPQLAVNGNQATLNNVTLGADIFYTNSMRDFPSPVNPNAIQAQDGIPFQFNPNCPLRWAAYQNGIGSPAGFNPAT